MSAGAAPVRERGDAFEALDSRRSKLMRPSVSAPMIEALLPLDWACGAAMMTFKPSSMAALASWCSPGDSMPSSLVMSAVTPVRPVPSVPGPFPSHVACASCLLARLSAVGLSAFVFSARCVASSAGLSLAAGLASLPTVRTRTSFRSWDRLRVAVPDHAWSH